MRHVTRTLVVSLITQRDDTRGLVIQTELNGFVAPLIHREDRRRGQILRTIFGNKAAEVLADGHGTTLAVVGGDGDGVGTCRERHLLRVAGRSTPAAHETEHITLGSPVGLGLGSHIALALRTQPCRLTATHGEETRSLGIRTGVAGCPVLHGLHTRICGSVGLHVLGIGADTVVEGCTQCEVGVADKEVSEIRHTSLVEGLLLLNGSLYFLGSGILIFIY